MENIKDVTGLEGGGSVDSPTKGISTFSMGTQTTELINQLNMRVARVSEKIDIYDTIVSNVKSDTWIGVHRDNYVAFIEKDVEILRKSLYFFEQISKYLSEAATAIEEADSKANALFGGGR